MPEEYAFVHDSWARSFQKSPWAGCVPNHLYPSVSRAAQQEILDRGAVIWVAYVELENGTRRVMGYSVSEPDRNILHWLFVKRDYRGLGVGTALLKQTVERFDKNKERVYTYRTRASAGFLGNAYKHKRELACIKA